MLVIPSGYSRDLCDGLTRRELVRVGGSAALGLSLSGILQAEEARSKGEKVAGGPGFGKAKSIILVYLQGGPSHLDLWDPKTDVPDNVKSVFKPIDTKLSGVQFPNFGSNIIRLKPPEQPMLPFVMLPRPLQESNVIGKGGNAGFLGRAYDPYTLYPAGDDMDLAKMDRISIDDLRLRPEITATRLERRSKLRDVINAGMPALDKAVSKSAINEYYGKALGLVLSGKARDAFDLSQETAETRDRYGKNTFGQSCLLARRLIEAGTRVVEVNWPKVANSDNHSWDVHSGLSARMKTQSAPMLDSGLSALIADLDERGLLAETLVVAVGEFGRSPIRGVSTSGNGNSDDGRDHWPYCYTAVVAGAGMKRGVVYGKSDKTASAPVENPVHPGQLLATMYHSVGLDPATIVYNHLNQPREMIQSEALPGLFA